MFYTYQWLREDGSPYYVGKGKGSRAYHNGIGHRAPKDRSRIVVQKWSDEATAFAFEVYLIDFWGRKDIGTGILHNRTDGGEGDSGREFSKEHRKKLSVAATGRGRSEVTRKKIREARAKQVITEETGKKISEHHMGHEVSEKSIRVFRNMLHTRWHVNRAIVKENCEICQEFLLPSPAVKHLNAVA
jgi:hypothetical protein